MIAWSRATRTAVSTSTRHRCLADVTALDSEGRSFAARITNDPATANSIRLGHRPLVCAGRRRVAVRAFAVLNYGETPAVHDLPIPDADGGFLIRVSNAGVNPLDSNLLERLTAASTYPFVMGIDFAGVIERGATGAGDLQAGERVFGMARTHGAYAEYTAVSPGVKSEPLARISDGITDEQAAALPIPATTALRTIELMQIVSGQRVVVMGAT